ncbi:MAG: 8-oxo-dGTP diphosphatase [Candidatus Moranbacteria bacterium]|nr:8-oxo-dGTP diphosphatase [Candidatus Moranbacteria bacterium]NTW45505.1 8-oxo-dGTP diphosphatase [Candidatus Moranbacteria bacterium]
MSKIMTLTMIVRDGKMLLGMKKRGFGVGKWNGFGGKVEEGESIREAAIREVFEESGLTVEELEEAGTAEFSFEDGTGSRTVHVFRCASYSGDPVETDEMRPEWFDLDRLPISDMWPADTHWLSGYFLHDKPFRAEFLYDHPTAPDRPSTILRMEISEIRNDENISGRISIR